MIISWGIALCFHGYTQNNTQKNKYKKNNALLDAQGNIRVDGWDFHFRAVSPDQIYSVRLPFSCRNSTQKYIGAES